MQNQQKDQWFESWFDSEYYHMLYDKRDHEEARDFVLKLLDYLSIKPGLRALDLACGKGRHARIMHKAGLDVTGLDLSQNSIDHLKPYENETLHFERWDMRDIYKEDYFHLIFNLFTSFGYFEDTADNSRVLDGVVKGLKEEGTFVLDYLNAHPISKENKVVRTEHKRKELTFNTHKFILGEKVIKDIMITDPAKGEFHFQERVQLFELDNLQRLFSKAGLEIIEVFGNYQLSPYIADESERLIVIAKKPSA